MTRIAGPRDVDSSPDSSNDRLDSWKEIAAHLKRSVRTVTRWEQEEGLPVHRHQHHKAGSVYAYKSELDLWWIARGSQLERERNPADNQLEKSSDGPAQRQRQVIVTVAVTAVLLAGALTALAALWFAARSRHLATTSMVTSTPIPMPGPLTTYPGIEGPPTLSPDGNQVAFERNGDIYIKQVDGEALLQLTKTAVAEEAPAWSPDGRHIAFSRAGTGIFLVSPLGGAERKIADTRVPHLLKAMSWTADGGSLVISEMTSSICASLFRVAVATGDKTRLNGRPSRALAMAGRRSRQRVRFSRSPATHRMRPRTSISCQQVAGFRVK